MASFNGSRFIKEQIESILNQIGDQDELVIVDDYSTDGTVSIIQNFADPRINLFANQCNMGVNFTFGKALSLARNEYVFLADQDDVWIPGRVGKMILALQSKKVMLVTSNCSYVNEYGDTILFSVRMKKELESYHYATNIFHIFMGSGNYPGCAMALNSGFLKIILPFPLYIESHDLWIAKAANLLASNYHIEEATLKRRIHNANVSFKKRPFLIRVRSRLIFIISIVHICYRIGKIKLLDINGNW